MKPTRNLLKLQTFPLMLTVLLFSSFSYCKLIYANDQLLGVGAMGDSLTDEYSQRASNYGDSSALNWVDLLARLRGPDISLPELTFGDYQTDSAVWGPPRYGGYDNNFALWGENTVTLLSRGQHTGIAALIRAGQVRYVAVFIGTNDFQPASSYGMYEAIYNSETPFTGCDEQSYASVQDYIDSIVERYTIALDTVLDAGGQPVMATIVDFGMAPRTASAQGYSDPNKRQNVTDAVMLVNYGLKSLAAAKGLPIVNMFELFHRFVVDPEPSLVGGVSIIKEAAPNPDGRYVILPDGAHPGTVLQGLLANAFIEACNRSYGANFTPLSDQEILASAGINVPEGDVTFFDIRPYIITKYSGGTGEPNDPYQIATAEALMLLGDSPEDYCKNFILTADIDLDPNLPGRKVFDSAVIAPYRPRLYELYGPPIGPLGPSKPNYFTGVFDGMGHTISHLTIDGIDDLGLFGRIENGAIVKNLILEAVNVSGTGSSVGSLVGSNSDSSITSCYSSGTVNGDSYVGGLVGYNRYGHIFASYYNGMVSVTGGIVGGLVGHNLHGTIAHCYTIGCVIGDVEVGGLVGNNDYGYLNGCYSTCTVSATGQYSSVGGLVGLNDNNSSIITSYSKGAVSGNEYVGGLVGSGGGNILNSIWDIETSGISRSCGGVGLTTTEMMNPYMLSLNGFADDPNWVLSPGLDYPHLIWEGTSGQVIPDPNVDWMEGYGTVAEPYCINTADQLTLMGKASILWDKHFILGADIDLDPDLPNRKIFSQAVIPVFMGNFDGRGHKISHLKIEGESFLGLFGRLDYKAIVSNLRLEVVDVNGTGDYVGGLAGKNGGSVATSHCTGIVTGGDYVGGLVGRGGWVTTSYNTSTVNGGDYVGGLTGFSSFITNSYNTGSVSGNDFVGGLVGFNSGSINTSFSTGSVRGNKNVGGLVGNRRYTYTTLSFWNTETSGQATSAGGRGLSTIEMQDINTYLNAGWDFVDEAYNGRCDYWQISPFDYPQLRYHDGSKPLMPDGLGTDKEPYLIRTARDLGTVWFEPGAHYCLESSVDLSEIKWSMAVIPWFVGTFDGKGHTISHLTIKGTEFLGLFGFIYSGAKISNLGMESADIIGTVGYIGGLVGDNGGNIISCYSTGSIRGQWYVGGLVGDNYGNIDTSHSSGTVRGDEDVGGLAGDNWDGSITSSYSTSTVSGDDSVGGLVGVNHNSSIITSYSNGSVSGFENVGGLVGYNNGNIATSYSSGTVRGDEDVGGLAGFNGGNINASYSTGAVSGEWPDIGGLVGKNSGSIATSYSTGSVEGKGNYVGGLVGGYRFDRNNIVIESFWDIENSGKSTSAGGTGKTTAEMQTASTFLEAGWDFMDEVANGTDDIWWIDEGNDYPRLWWELIPEN